MTKLIGGAAFACLVVLVVAAAAFATASSGFSREQTDMAGSSTGGPASRWVATDLGKLPGDRWLAVADINDRGQVVGGRGLSRGFIWQNGRMTGLAMRIEPATTLVRQAINERGQIIGTSRQHAVLWEKGRMIDLGFGATAINERGQTLGYRHIWQDGKVRKLPLNAQAINNRGQVAGAISVAFGGSRAVMWQNGKITTLGDGNAVDINDRGDVLGQRLEATGWRVILWRNGTEIDLGPGWPVAINERGQVTGVTRTPAGEWGFAFLWQNGRMTDLGTLGGRPVFPTAISNRGQVVGTSVVGTSDESGVQRAFVWQSGTMTELGSPKGTTGPDASRTRAIAINEHNQIIGDNCIWDCAGVSKFAVIWTLRRKTVAAVAATSTRDLQAPRNGEWIAYSTTPGVSVSPRRGLGGSDVFVVRQGRAPMLVASREDGRTPESRSLNVCPTFSPDGTMLAFGTWSPTTGFSLSVVRMTRAGRRAHLEVRDDGGLPPPCPQWSADSSRLAYVRAGKVIVRGLDGSTRRAGVGDPVIQDFGGRHAKSLTSPTGDLVARLGDFPPCGVVVERPDGSQRRNLDAGCPYGFYAVAAWSPDGRKLLLMRDVSGLDFTMFAVSVDAPFKSVLVVKRVRVPNGHTWPGRFDVSWQPRPS